VAGRARARPRGRTGRRRIVPGTPRDTGGRGPAARGRDERWSREQCGRRGLRRVLHHRPQGRPAVRPLPGDAGRTRPHRTHLRADGVRRVHRAAVLLRLRHGDFGLHEPRVLRGPRQRRRGPAPLHGGEAHPRDSRGHVRLVLPDEQAPPAGAELVRPPGGGARRVDGGSRRGRQAVRRENQPGHRLQRRPRRLGVGRHAVRGRPHGRQGHRLRDALRRGVLEVRRVRRLLRRPPVPARRPPGVHGRRAGSDRRRRERSPARRRRGDTPPRRGGAPPRGRRRPPRGRRERSPPR